MGKPQVTLTLAGDESQLTQAFDRVGQASRTMADDVGASSRRVAEDSESGFDRAGEAADGAEGRAQGFSDTLTGVADIGAGTSQIMQGNLFEGFVTVGQGAADLAGGLASFVIPALKNMTLSSLANARQTARTTTAMVAQKGAMIASAVATNAMAVAQRVLNVAMRANPIGLVVTALILIGTALVAAYKKSETFRSIVNGAFNGVKLAIRGVVETAQALYGWVRTNAPKIGGFFKNVADTLAAPWRTAFNGIRSAWNNTVGGKGFTVPGWIPNLGGKDFRIPYFHTGGIVSGAMGSQTLAMLKAGERVTGGRGSAGGVTIVLKSDGSRASRALLELMRQAIQVTTGGDVQAALGR